MIVVAGEALIDLLIHRAGGLTAVRGGGPYNAARTIGRLGGHVAFVGGLSGDRFGHDLRAGLVADGVDDTFALATEAPTTLAVAELDGDGIASYRFYTAGTSAVALDAGHLPALGGARVDALHVGTLGLVLEPMASAIERLVAAVPDEAIVMLDANSRPAATPDRDAYLARVRRLLRRADVVKVSTDDLRFLQPSEQPEHVAASLLDAGPRAVLWTAGGAAVRVLVGGFERMIEPPPVEVVDTVGAGDAFGGAFLAAWIDARRRRADLGLPGAVVEAATFATRVASMTCTRAGAEPPTRRELGAWESMTFT